MDTLVGNDSDMSLTRDKIFVLFVNFQKTCLCPTHIIRGSAMRGILEDHPEENFLHFLFLVHF